MRNIFGKYWRRYLIVIATILVAAVLIHIFKSTNCIAAWLFSFVDGWAAAFSASAAFFLVITALLAIRENRRTRDMDTVRSWAENAIMLLYLPSSEELPLLKWSELEIKLKSIFAKSVGVLAIADKFGGDFEKNVKKASAKLISLIETVERANRFADAMPSVEELLKDLADVMDSASKL